MRKLKSNASPATALLYSTVVVRAEINVRAFQEKSGYRIKCCMIFKKYQYGTLSEVANMVGDVAACEEFLQHRFARPFFKNELVPLQVCIVVLSSLCCEDVERPIEW